MRVPQVTIAFNAKMVIHDWDDWGFRLRHLDCGKANNRPSPSLPRNRL